MEYIINEDFKIYCGFEVCGTHVLDAITQANTILSDLPSTLYKVIDYKTTSAMIGAIFCATLAGFVDGVVNPIEKGIQILYPRKVRIVPRNNCVTIQRDLRSSVPLVILLKALTCVLGKQESNI
jgi:hypothetical protein